MSKDKYDELYWQDTEGGRRYQRLPTGTLDVNRLIRGEAPWIVTTQASQSRPKKLILADWGARTWPDWKRTAVCKRFEQLMEEGFSIYLWQKGKVIPLEKKQMKWLDDTGVLSRITLAHPDEIIRHAIKQHHLTRSQLLVLDAYQIEQLLREDDAPIPRGVRLSTLDSNDLTYRSNLFSWYLPNPLINDKFSLNSIWTLNEIRQRFPQLTILNNIRTLSLNVMQSQELIETDRVTIVGESFHVDQLEDVETITLCIMAGDEAKLSRLLSKVSRCRGLKLSSIGPLPDIQIVPGSLSRLDELSIGIKGALGNLKRLLAAAPRIRELHFESGFHFEQPQSGHLQGFELPRLDHLDVLHFSGMQIENSKFLKEMLASAPQLRELSCNYTVFSDVLDLEPNSLAYLNKLSLRGSLITLRNLANLLRAAPNLEVLDLTDCTFSERSLESTKGPFDLISNSLPKLTQAILTGSSPLSAEDLATLEAATPQLRGSQLIQSEKTQIEQTLFLPAVELPGTSYELKPEGPLQALTSNVGEGLELFIPTTSEAPPGTSRPAPVVDPRHRVEAYRNLDPTQYQEQPFDFQDTNKTLNQGMVIDKLCQYFRVTHAREGFIPYLRLGICNALSHWFVQQEKEFREALAAISTWDGQWASLTADVRQAFEDLFQYVQRYQFRPDEAPLYFLGENLKAFLESSQGVCILANPWHAIAIRQQPGESLWWMYDSNGAEGPKAVTSEQLPQVIKERLGPLVMVEGVKCPFTPHVTDVNAFLEQGGLLVLGEVDDKAALLSQLTPCPRLMPAALDGLLLRKNTGMPAWVLGIQLGEAIGKLTVQLLTQFLKTYPKNGLVCLSQSLEHVDAMTRHACIEQMLQWTVGDEDVMVRDRLIPLLRFTPSREDQRALQTWKVRQAMPSSVPAYGQRVLQPGSARTRLITLESDDQVHALQHALQAHAQSIHRPVFVIHSPDDLVCAAPFVKREADNHGILHPGPGGPLHDFLEAHRRGEAPVLLVNYNAFRAEDLVRFNTLLDAHRVIDGTPLPEDTLVIGLINTRQPDCYQGSDFYSRFDVMEACPVTSSLVSPTLPLRDAPLDDSPHPVINLYHAADWKERLIGRWVLNQDTLTYEQGELPRALAQGTVIEIQNGLWEDAAFQRFWEQALQQGFVEYAGQRLSIPKELSFIRVVKSRDLDQTACTTIDKFPAKARLIEPLG